MVYHSLFRRNKFNCIRLIRFLYMFLIPHQSYLKLLLFFNPNIFSINCPLVPLFLPCLTSIISIFNLLYIFFIYNGSGGANGGYLFNSYFIKHILIVFRFNIFNLFNYVFNIFWHIELLNYYYYNYCLYIL